MANKYDVWYETITDNSIKRHFVAQGLPFRKAHEVKREHPYRHYIHVTQAAQQPLAPEITGTCEYCDKPKNSPNFAYHVCVGRKAGKA